MGGVRGRWYWGCTAQHEIHIKETSQRQVSRSFPKSYYALWYKRTSKERGKENPPTQNYPYLYIHRLAPCNYVPCFDVPSEHSPMHFHSTKKSLLISIHVTTSDITTFHVTTSHVTTSHVTTSHVTTSHVTTLPLTPSSDAFLCRLVTYLNLYSHPIYNLLFVDS